MKHFYYDGDHGVTIDLIGQDALWIITRVETYPTYRRQGYARATLELVCADADKEGSTLMLSVDPDGTGPGRQILLPFYESLGFELMQPTHNTMRRLPR